MVIEYNLKDVFTGNCEDHYNCIYAIKNLLDGRYYIGQCIDFYNRFTDNKMWSHLIGDQYIDNSIRLHGPKNFIVKILHENLTKDEMDNLEILYISRLHTFDSDPYWNSHIKLHKQYNQLPGGYSSDRYKYMVSMSLDARYEYGDGDPAYMMHTNSAIKKSAKTRTELYGSPNACCNSSEVRKKADETNRKHHGGVLAWNLDSTYDYQRSNHGGVLAFNTEISVLHQLISVMNKNIQLVKSNGFELNIYNLYYHSNPYIHAHLNSLWEHWAGSDLYYNCPEVPKFYKYLLKWLEQFTSWSQVYSEFHNMELTGNYL